MLGTRRLKAFAADRLPDCALRDVLLAEGDEITNAEFLARLPIWLSLLRRIARERD
jgi:hypothetical protein